MSIKLRDSTGQIGRRVWRAGERAGRKMGARRMKIHDNMVPLGTSY